MGKKHLTTFPARTASNTGMKWGRNGRKTAVTRRLRLPGQIVLDGKGRVGLLRGGAFVKGVVGGVGELVFRGGRLFVGSLMDRLGSALQVHLLRHLLALNLAARVELQMWVGKEKRYKRKGWIDGF